MDFYKQITLGEECFVYPQGGCARVVVNILKDCFEGLRVKYIDDSVEGLSLEEQKEQILASQSYVLVCAGEIQDVLLEKCRANGMDSKVIDGREYAAFCLADQILKKSMCGGGADFEVLENGRVLHIHEDSWIKHYYFFYDLFIYYLSKKPLEYLNRAVFKYCQATEEKLLAENSFDLEFQNTIGLSFYSSTLQIAKYLKTSKQCNIMWHFYYSDYYEQNQESVKNEKVIIVPYSLCDYFIRTKVNMYCGTSVPRYPNKHKSINVGMGHSMAEAFIFCPRAYDETYLHQYLSYCFLGFDYYCAIDVKSASCYQKIFDTVKLPTRILHAGSPNLDLKMQQGITKASASQFFLIPRSTSLDDIVKIIALLLEHSKKVVFRPHPSFNYYMEYLNTHDSYNIFEPFLQNENFTIDYSPNISLQMLRESIVVTDQSSVAYSAPLISLKPVILYSNASKEFDLRIERFGESFQKPALHRVVYHFDEFMKVALALEQELQHNMVALEEAIKQYRDQNIFHLGCSAQKIAEMLLALLHDENLQE